MAPFNGSYGKAMLFCHKTNGKSKVIHFGSLEKRQQPHMLYRFMHIGAMEMIMFRHSGVTDNTVRNVIHVIDIIQQEGINTMLQRWKQWAR